MLMVQCLSSLKLRLWVSRWVTRIAEHPSDAGDGLHLSLLFRHSPPR